MKTRLFFTLTERERDALLVLHAFRPLWLNLDPRTFASLHRKGLVAFGVAPALTDAGRLAATLTRLLVTLTRVPAMRVEA